MEIGKYNHLKISRFTTKGLILTDDSGNEALLPSKFVPEKYKYGENIRVFVYPESKDVLIATTLRPYAIEGDFAYLRVSSVTRVGAFLDWGLPKELLCPFRQQKDRMVQGNSYIVRIYLDTISSRLVATSKIGGFLSNDDIPLQEGEKVDIFICEPNDVGYRVIVNKAHWGIIYKNEIFRRIRIGEFTSGFLKNIRPDGKLDVSLQQQGYNEVLTAEKKLQKLLESNGGFLPLNDDSAPDDIYRFTEMSKKVFKKAVGGLYRERMITIEENGIRLR